MRLPGQRTALKAVRWARSRFRPGPLILGYHRIADTRWDPQSLCVSPRNLSEQLEVLRRHARIESLVDLSQALTNGTLSRRAVAITFDDGYEDTATVALPLLQRHDALATVFVASGFIARSFWWMDLQRAVEAAEDLPGELHFHIGDRAFSWSGGEGNGQAKALLRSLCRVFRSLSCEDQVEALGVLYARLRVHRVESLDGLTHRQTAALAASGIVEVGSHTVTHKSLGELDVDQQRKELGASKHELEALTGRPVRSFSFPNGVTSRQSAGIAASLGYVCGCTSREDVVAPACSPFLLPRLWVPDWDGERFSRWLHRWLK